MRRLQRLPEAVSGKYSPQVNQEKTDGQAHTDACLRYICGKECLQTKSLWQEVFFEDSERFTDYYFRVKAPENEGFVLEGEEGLRAMLFLTPERIRVFEKEVQSAYIVGVATRQQFRHRKYMARLLQESMDVMYARCVPFIFLMPASAAIYEPFDFRFIYDRPLWDAGSLRKDLLKPLGAESAGAIAAFSRELLEMNAAVHICRDAAYDRVMLEEIAAQEGTVFGYFDCAADKKDLSRNDAAHVRTQNGYDAADTGALKGICLYTCEDGEADIQEVLAAPEVEAEFVVRHLEKKPCIMARIIHLPALLGLLRSAVEGEEMSFGLQVTDSHIPANNGCFLCHAFSQGCTVQRADEREAAEFRRSCGDAFWSGSIAELVQRIFGYENDGCEGVWGRLRLLNPVWINEIV